LRPVLALVLVQWLLPSSALSSAPSAYEIAISARESGHLRGLVEKLAKQNVLFQFRFGDVTKAEMQETASQIDRIIYTLEKGSAAYSVAPPTTRRIAEQLNVVDSHWGGLRRVALASPYDYLRFQSDLVPPRSRQGDPFLIRAFDQRASDVIEQAEKLMRMYQSECKALQGQFCVAAGRSGFFNMRVERVAKELVLVYVGIDVDARLQEMRTRRDEFDESISLLSASPILTQAMESSRGKSAQFVSRLWDSVQEGWGKLRFEADMALDGHADGLDIPRMLRVQRELVDDLDRLRAALSRYAQGVMEG
jgi:hypothetical protein